MEESDVEGMKVVNRFGAAIIAGDYAAASSTFAPWLNIGAGELKTRITKVLDTMPPPTEFEFGSNPFNSPSTFREHLDRKNPWIPTRPIPDELQMANFRGFARLYFRPPEGGDVDLSFEIWLLLANVGHQVAVGWFEESEGAG